MSAVESKKLSKKEKKAQAFRATKGKSKSSKQTDDQLDVPELDDLDVAEEDREESKAKAAEKQSKKKRPREEDDAEEGEAVKEGEEGEEPKKKKRQRGKKKNVQPGIGVDGKPRLVLFVGNLPYKVTADEIKKHFEPCGETPAVRLLTPKPTPGSTAAPKSKGCSFIEFTLATALQAALRLHESEFQGRKINVELTAGGGGNSAARKDKIDTKRKALTEEREKTAKNRREREGVAEKPKSRAWGPPAPVAAELAKGAISVGEGGDGKGELKTRVTVVNGKKVRDRRLPKVGADGVEKERARKVAARADKFSSGANHTPLGQ